jgi:hypothetical protein
MSKLRQLFLKTNRIRQYYNSKTSLVVHDPPMTPKSTVTVIIIYRFSFSQIDNIDIFKSAKIWFILRAEIQFALSLLAATNSTHATSADQDQHICATSIWSALIAFHIVHSLTFSLKLINGCHRLKDGQVCYSKG